MFLIRLLTIAVPMILFSSVIAVAEEVVEESVKTESLPQLETPAKPETSKKYQPRNNLSSKVVFLQGLNKITARVSTLELMLNESIFFGNIEIIAHSCWRSPPEEMPESKVLLEIWEKKPDEERQNIFHGWMFASNPGLSALEHPVYDVTVLDCQETNG